MPISWLSKKTYTYCYHTKDVCVSKVKRGISFYFYNNVNKLIDPTDIGRIQVGFAGNRIYFRAISGGYTFFQNSKNTFICQLYQGTVNKIVNLSEIKIGDYHLLYDTEEELYYIEMN